MITLEDCIAMCGLTEEEVLAIAEHEHIPEIAAAALAQYLLCQDHGAERTRDMLKDDIRAALARKRPRTRPRAVHGAARLSFDAPRGAPAPFTIRHHDVRGT